MSDALEQALVLLRRLRDRYEADAGLPDTDDQAELLDEIDEFLEQWQEKAT